MIQQTEDDDDDSQASTNVCLYQLKNESIKPKELFCGDKMEEIDIYSKDSEEIYIATSPSFSEVDAKSIDEVYSGTEHDSCSNRSDSTQSTNFEDETNRDADFQCTTKDESLTYGSKVINTYPAISTASGQGYLVSPDFSQLNNLGIEVSKTFYYVLSPMGTVNTLIRASSEQENKHMNLVNNKQEGLEDDEITPRLVSQNHEEVMNDNEKEYCLNEFHQENEHIDLAQTEITSDEHLHSEEHVHMEGDFDNLNQEYQVNFIHGIPDQVNSPTKERTQLVWEPLTTGDQDSKKNVDKSHTVLMKYDHTSKMELPIIHGQPYLQVALVNDLEPAATSELVSTDQILGVTVPEIFTCKWESCGTHFLSKNDLVKHANSSHVNTDGGAGYVCYWKGCVREGKEFDARYKLLIHLRTHTGEKPHSCPVEGCTAAFSRIENLKIHVRTHTGERPYPCPYEGCNKSFANSSDRFKHRRTHTERKPYRCPIKGCEKSYTDPSSLRKHRKRHTDKTTN